jgi:hypothetical protein
LALVAGNRLSGSLQGSAEHKVFDGSLGALQGATTAAVDALKRNLTCGNASAEVQAARTILDYTMKARELLDLAARVQELERLAKRSEDGAQTKR